MYFTATIRAKSIHLGYDSNGEIVKKELSGRNYVEKVIKLDRILSFTDDYIFISCPHDTVEVWEYQGDLSEVKSRLAASGKIIA